MNAITQTLLGGAAVCALASASAMAEDAPHFSITALHAGGVVHKTKMSKPHCNIKYCTYTVSVYISTYVPASDFRIQKDLSQTYYKWDSSLSFCTTPKQRVKGQKRSTYGKITHNTETYSLGCASGPSVFYGDAYTLTKASGEGQVDPFSSSLIGRFKNGSVKYKGDLKIFGVVDIGK